MVALLSLAAASLTKAAASRRSLGLLKHQLIPLRDKLPLVLLFSVVHLIFAPNFGRKSAIHNAGK